MSDPRFDPAFQRGYSGPEPELVPRSAAPVGGVVPPEDPPAVAVPTAGLTVESLTVESLTVGQTLRTSEHRGRNPYRLALLVGGLALLLGAVSMIFEVVRHPHGSSTTVESQFVNLLVGDLPPALTLSGLICLIAWLALGALDRVVRGDED